MNGILIVPFCDISKDIRDILIDGLKRIFNKEVEISRNISMPEHAYNRERGQYLSSAFIEVLLNTDYLENYERLLGITDVDLYVPQQTKRDINSVITVERGRGL